MYASRPNFVPLKVIFGTMVKRDHKVLGYSVSRVAFRRMETKLTFFFHSDLLSNSNVLYRKPEIDLQITGSYCLS